MGQKIYLHICLNLPWNQNQFLDRNAHRFSHLFKKAEDLFSRLDHVKSRFVDWVALGAVDIEDYIMQTCTKADDWEANFRASKARGQVLYSRWD